MEGLRMVWDGSEGTFWNGFIFNAVSVFGIPFLFDHEEVGEWEEELKNTRFRVFSEQVLKIVSLFGSDHWIAADRLYDDVKKFNLLMEQKMKFIIRMKTSRYVTIIAQEGVQSWEKANENIAWKTYKVGDIPEGRYTVIFKGLLHPCFLTVVKFPKCENSIRVLSNVNDSQSVNDIWNDGRLNGYSDQKNRSSIWRELKHTISIKPIIS